MASEKKLKEELANVYSNDIVLKIQKFMTEHDINPNDVSGIYECLDTEGDYGLLTYDGKRISMRMDVINNPQKLCTGLLVLSVKCVYEYIDESRKCVLGIYNEFNTDRMGKMIGLCKVVRNCMDRRNCSHDVLENQVNSLLVTQETIYRDIISKGRKIKNHEDDTKISKTRKTERDHIAETEESLAEMVVLYFDSINLCIEALCVLGEPQEAKALIKESIERIEKDFGNYQNQLYKSWDKDFYKAGKKDEDPHAIWDTFINDEKKILNQLSTKFENPVIEMKWE